MQDMIQTWNHCMQDEGQMQMRHAVKKIAWKRLPFAIGATERRNQFERVWKRSEEDSCKREVGVWSDFEQKVLEVREVGTSMSWRGDIMSISEIGRG